MTGATPPRSTSIRPLEFPLGADEMASTRCIALAGAMMVSAAASIAPAGAQTPACLTDVSLPGRSAGVNNFEAPKPRDVVIDDFCENVYATYPVGPSGGTNQVQVTNLRTLATSILPSGDKPWSVDFSPNARRADASRGIAGTGRAYVANNGENKISIIDLATDAVSSVALPLAAAATQKPKYIGVAANGAVLIATDAGNGGIRLFQYDPVAGTFRDRTADIPGQISEAALKTARDRSWIEGITAGDKTYAYFVATNSFAEKTPTTTSGLYSGTSVLTSDGKLRYVTSPYASWNDGSVVVQNMQTGALIARLNTRDVPMWLANGPALSGDESVYSAIGAMGPIAISVKKSDPVATMVYSSLGARSVLRFHNSGVEPGTVDLTFRHSETGAELGRWTSPVIPAGASVQYHVVSLEQEMGLYDIPQRYAVTAQPSRGLFGSLQHLVWDPELTSLTNYTTCDHPPSANAQREPSSLHAMRVRLSTDPHQLAGVHSTVFADYPSTVALTRWEDASAAPAGVPLGIYDGRNGAKLGEYVTPPIAGKGHLDIPVAAIEAALGFSPAPDQHYYVVIAPPSFKGFLQHRMHSGATGATSDLTAACQLNSDLQITQSLSLPDGPALRTTDFGGVYSTAQSDTVSFFHFGNHTDVARSITVTLHFQGAAGPVQRTWASPRIPARGELQVLVDTIERESGPPFEKPQTYTATVGSGAEMAIQHYVWRPAQQQLVNASTCSTNAPATRHAVFGLHSSMYNVDYPSVLIAHSNLSVDQNIGFIVRGRDGQNLGNFTLPLAAGAQRIIPVAEIEAMLGITPSWDVPRYNVFLSGFGNWGSANSVWFQHVIMNRSDGRIEDMTQACRPWTASYIKGPYYPTNP